MSHKALVENLQFSVVVQGKFHLVKPSYPLAFDIWYVFFKSGPRS